MATSGREINDAPHARRRDDARPVDRLRRPYRRRSPQDVDARAERLLRGTTSIGEGTTIGAGSQIVDSTIGRGLPRLGRASIEGSIVEDERPDRPVQPPPAGQPRRRAARRSATTPRSRTAASARGVQQHHMSYLGDADVGAGTNVGAGTITANYDGAEQAPDDDRRARLPRRRHDARRAGRRSATGRRPAPGPSSRRDVPAGQARGRRAGADPRAARPPEPRAGRDTEAPAR